MFASDIATVGTNHFNVFNSYVIWAEHRTHNLPNAEIQSQIPFLHKKIQKDQKTSYQKKNQGWGLKHCQSLPKNVAYTCNVETNFLYFLFSYSFVTFVQSLLFNFISMCVIFRNRYVCVCVGVFVHVCVYVYVCVCVGWIFMCVDVDEILSLKHNNGIVPNFQSCAKNFGSILQYQFCC